MSTHEEEKSLVLPGDFGKTLDNILIIKEFIEKQDLKTMNNFFPTIDQWENGKDDEFNEDGICIYDSSYWRDRMCSGDILQRIAPDIFAIINKYILKMADAISGKYNAAIIAKNIELDITIFNRYNPEFDSTMSTQGNYDLRLPSNKMQLFVAKKYPILNESLQALLNGTNIPAEKTVSQKEKKNF